tara:strand:+ start:150 stop:1061 length:912 start_codon:yes stop_codon:yes gene_type:complete
MKICAVIPCYKVSNKIISELKKNYQLFDLFIVVDDCCPNKIGSEIKKKFKRKNKVKVIFNNKNLGVGGSVKKGIYYAIKKNIDIIVKIDGDCQTKFQDIKKIKKFLIKDFEFVKGNRFLKSSKVNQMPLHRNFGNRIISIIFKLLSNRWDIDDPLNGYIAFNKKLVKKINFKKIANDYFFETNLLFEIAQNRIPIKHFSNYVTYRDDILSSFNPLTELLNFSIKMFAYFFKRLSENYLNLERFNINTFLLVIIIFTLSKFGYDSFISFLNKSEIVDYISLKIGLLIFPAFYFIDYFNIKIKKK